MNNNTRKNLFQMVLKASPYGGFVFSPNDINGGDNFTSMINDINNKMESFLDDKMAKQLITHLHSSLKYLHPAIFPVEHDSKTYFLVVLPIMDDPKEGERLCLLVQNQTEVKFTPPLLKEDSWHEINNPLAIISLTLQKVFKKETLDQEDIDTLLERINSSFSRIETFISGQISMSAL